jgi:ATP-binding protein involved in chromosome partitioning
VALSDVLKAIGMFEKVKIPILGIVENMSYFICPHCRERTEILSMAADGCRPAPDDPVPRGNRHRSSHPGRRRCGRTHCRQSPDSPQTQQFHEVAGQVAARVSTQNFLPHKVASVDDNRHVAVGHGELREAGKEPGAE